MELDLATVYLGEGQFALGKREMGKVLKQDAKNMRALALLDQLHAAESSWLKIKGNYNTDSQPLQTITPSAEAGVYLHPEATLRLNLQTPLFIANSALFNAQWFQIGDVSAFRKAGFQFTFDAGIVKQPFENKISWTGNIELKQILAKHLVLQAQAERKPYYYTLSSLDTVLMVNRFSAYAEWNDLNTWNGRIAFEFNQFPANNYVLGASGWVFTPPLKVSVFEFRIGYAYSFSTSKTNEFVPEKTLAQILTNYDASAPITGIYDPYFTPLDMDVHAGRLPYSSILLKFLTSASTPTLGFMPAPSILISIWIKTKAAKPSSPKVMLPKGFIPWSSAPMASYVLQIK